MFSSFEVRGVRFEPARFCAPLASLTHSAFRRLVSGFGGCGAFWTEMLAGKQVLHEDLRNSPYHRRRPGEGKLIFQLMVRDQDRVDQMIDRLAEIEPDGIDINLACHAPLIRRHRAGSGLFMNRDALESVLRIARESWPGLLTVKIRLGSEKEGWEQVFEDRLKLFEDCGVDAIVVHPRFFEDKFKRRVRHELFPWIVSLTSLPVIGNGDILGPETVAKAPSRFEGLAGLMVGRMAVVHPWVFGGWDHGVDVDRGEVWQRMCDYICEDFDEDTAIKRVRLFTRYYARNFLFGHSFNTAIQNAPTIEEARARAGEFFARDPVVHDRPPLLGI